jgi:hypothetical protein
MSATHDWINTRKLLVAGSIPAFKAFFKVHPINEVCAIGYTWEWGQPDAAFYCVANTQCCGTETTLNKIKDDYPCMFGRFAIQVTDTMKTYSDVEMDQFRSEIATRLGCPIRYLEARY